MSKYEKLIEKILKGKNVSYDEVEKMLIHLGFQLKIRGSHHIPKRIQNLVFGFEKASRLNDRKLPHISNIRQLTIVQARELSLCQKSNFECVSVYISQTTISSHPVYKKKDSITCVSNRLYK